MAETDRGRGIAGGVDGLPPEGVEGEVDIAWGKPCLRQIGYRL